MRNKILKLASEEFEVDRDDLELINGEVRVKKDATRTIFLGDLAQRANPLRGAVKPGMKPGLEATDYFGPEMGATAYGAHAMIVEVDPDTLLVEIKRYVAIHDCGEMINPLIVDGQIHGGIAQGIGNAFYEALHFDENGTILNASLMDYLLPTALDVPRIEIDHTTTPAPNNALGVKGAGEAGAIPVAPLFVQAVEDALDNTIELNEIPLSPNRLWEIVTDSKQAAKNS